MEALNDEIGKPFGLFLLDKAVAVKIITRQKRVVDERKLRHRPMTKTLLGHVAQALGATHRPDRDRRPLQPKSFTEPFVCLSSPMQTPSNRD